MQIKPKYNTTSIKISSPIKRKNLKSKVIKDPQNQIDNGIYKVIRWEKSIQIINIILSCIILLTSITFIAIYFFVYKSSWFSFILPIIVGLLSFWKLVYCIMEKNRLNREIKKYREDLQLDLRSQPPFIIRIYSNIFIKQVRHNWITFFLMFNGGIFTLILWWLKDVSFWIFEFDKWIKKLFHNPDLMVIIFTISLFLISIIHIFFAIQRKKRILEIESYFGDVIIPLAEIREIKSNFNKKYFRLFIFYLMIIIIIPIIIKWIIKVFKKK